MKCKTIDLQPEVSQFTAAGTMLAAMAVVGIVDNIIPVLARDIGLWQFYLMRALLSVPLLCVFSAFGLGKLTVNRVWPVLLRSVLLGVSMMFYFSAVALMPIAQAIAGLFTSPIFIVVISVVFLGLRIGLVRVGAIFLGFIGVLFVLQPDLYAFDWLILMPVAGGFFYALGTITTRTLCDGESTIAMLLGMLLAQAVMGMIGLGVLEIWPQDVAAGADGFVTRGWVWPVWSLMHWMLLQVIGSVVGVYLIIKAYQQGEASFVAVFEYSVMIVGPAFAWLVFGQTVGLWQIFGIGLIVLAGSVIALRSR
ncbi:DMT family transporter [Aliisedimentitalea scapharcae]|uniref:DMT family transporter n=1 Tax=Aliisedimentitalea scapharcae TaxID=1524259 RepID=A0ABZ2XT49_9RHOB